MKVKTISDLQTAIRTFRPKETGILSYIFTRLDGNGELVPYVGMEFLFPYVKDTDILLENENTTQQLLRRFQWDIPNSPIDSVKLNNLTVYLISFFNAHKYELETLIGTTQFEYNPIDNVSEDTTETYQGDGTEKGDQNRTLNYAQDKTTTNENLGSRVDSGSSSGSQNKGKTAGQFTQSNNVAPYDDDIFHSDTQNINNHSEDAATDTTSATTNTTQGAQENNYTTTRNARNDTDNLNIDMVNTTSYTKHILRHGNIGVTSSQQLIQSEREIAHFSICEEIRRLFASACLIQVYESEV